MKTYTEKSSENTKKEQEFVKGILTSYGVKRRDMVPLELLLELLGPLKAPGRNGGFTARLEGKFGVLLESLGCVGDSVVVINDGCQYLTIRRAGGVVEVTEGIVQVSKYTCVITGNPLEKGYRSEADNSPEARRLRRILQAQERVIDDIISHFSPGGNMYHQGYQGPHSGWSAEQGGQPHQRGQIHPTMRILKQYALREIEAAWNEG